MMLTAEQAQSYRDHGWLVIENVFNVAETDAIRDLATSIAEEDILQQDVASHALDIAEDGSAAPRKIAAPFKRDLRFRQFVLQDKLTDILFGLLGDSALLATDQIFMKPPRHGSEKPFHQDNFYFNVTPEDALITAWIALDDVDEANGCLKYIDGSHKEGLIHHKPVPGESYNLTPKQSDIDLQRAVPAVVKKGGVVFHHGTCLHGSGANTSDRWRRGYATHWVTAAAESTSGLLDNAYFRQAALYQL